MPIKAGILLRGRVCRVGDAYAAPPATDLPDRAAQRATSDRAAQRDHFYSFLGPYINSWAANSTAFISSTHYGLSQPRARVSTTDSASPGLASPLRTRPAPGSRLACTAACHTPTQAASRRCRGAGRADRSGTGRAPSKGFRDAVTHWRPPLFLDIQVGDRPRPVQGFKGLAVRVSKGLRDWPSGCLRV